MCPLLQGTHNLSLVRFDNCALTQSHAADGQSTWWRLVNCMCTGGGAITALRKEPALFFPECRKGANWAHPLWRPWKLYMLNCYKKNIAPVVEKVLKLGDPASFWKGFSLNLDWMICCKGRLLGFLQMRTLDPPDGWLWNWPTSFCIGRCQLRPKTLS